MLYHATCVCMENKGILILGASGAGKSDLALRLIEAGAVLVADDAVELTAENGLLQATCPSTILGRMEVRGIGIVDVPFVEKHSVDLVLDLTDGMKIERMPEDDFFTFENVSVRRFLFSPFDVSALAKIKVILKQKRFFS